LHGGTYAGHPGACVAALVNLDIIERERLVERAATLEPTLRRLIAPLARLPGVADVRSAGLAAAIELDPDLVAAHPTAGVAVVGAARRHRVISRALRGVALQISPPLIVAEEELVSIVDGLGAAIEETLPSLGA
jgi:putrescine---pyruvate transaminase